MASEIKRYALYNDPLCRQETGEMVEERHGPYVTFTDYEALCLRSSAAADEVGRLRQACRVAMDHILELEEAWRSGALTSCDGQNGPRSNRNVEVRNIIRAATDASGAMKHKENGNG